MEINIGKSNVIRSNKHSNSNSKNTRHFHHPSQRRNHYNNNRPVSKASRFSTSTGNSSKDSIKKIVIRQHLTPDVVEVNGWRLPKEVAEYALANDLTEDQLYDYEGRLLEQERLDEIEFQRRRMIIASGWNEMSKCTLLPCHRVDTGDFRNQLDDATLEDLEKDVKLKLPPRSSRLWYFGFQHNWSSSVYHQQDRLDTPNRPASAASTNSQRMSKLGQSVAILKSVFTSKYRMNSGLDLAQEESDSNVHLNRHLKSVSVLRKRPLSPSDLELLRCIGLDTFVMIRFLRFCFDATFLPFIAACIILFPSYNYSNFQGDIQSQEGTTVKTQTDGYFSLTINRLEPSSDKLWICWGFTFFYLLFILRRLWIEWETFLPLRFDFLANGDVDNEKTSDSSTSYKSRAVVAPQKDVQLHLEQYRNSCLVEFIPDSHRRDRELFQFFEAVFPGQVKRAEILLNATELTTLMKKRQSLIEQYEDIYAKFSYDKKRFFQSKEGNSSGNTLSCWECLKCRACRGGPKKPEDPTLKLDDSKIFCCGKKVVKALPHILAEIKVLNRRIESEYKKVTQDKQLVEDTTLQNDLFHKTVGTAKTMITGEGSELRVRSPAYIYILHSLFLCSNSQPILDH